VFIRNLAVGTVVLSFALFVDQLYLEACIVKLCWTVLKKWAEFTILTLFMLVLSGVICRRPEFKSGRHKNSPNWLLPICSFQHFEHHIVRTQ
jgi:hypothetical protein